MHVGRIVPILFGVLVLLLGVYLVSSHGYIGGTYLPGLVGIPDCTNTDPNSSFNSTSPSCGGFSLYGSVSVGTVVALFGLGIIGTSVRSAMMGGGTGGMGGPAMTPEMMAMMQRAQAQPQTMPPPPSQRPAGGPDPVIRYCQKCGKANSMDAQFCQGCGTAMPPPPPPPA